MRDKVFVDTNILVYAHDVTAGSKYETAKKRILELWKSKAGCLSLQVIQEFYVTVTQKVPNPLDYSTAKEIIQDLSYWEIHEPKIENVLKAVDFQQRFRISFWDAMILQSATQLNCDQIWSEDLNPGQVYENIKLVNPLL